MEQSNKKLCAALLAQFERILDGRSMRFMEVCGTHTVALFQSGLRGMLPKTVTHLSGPGCPVCVTHDGEIAAFLELALLPNVCLATFGDLLRVPGPNGTSLKHAKAQGAHIEIVYSPLEALLLAQKYPNKTVCFLGIGFETTAPTVAATVVEAKKQGLSNFCVLSLHKLVPPVLRALLEDASSHLDAFLLPGHVSTIIGLQPYQDILTQYHIPGVVAGFEAQDLLLALCMLAKSFVASNYTVRNAYMRCVKDCGNPNARAIMERVFEPCDALWRGLGRIEKSGLRLRQEFADFDAVSRFGLVVHDVPSPKGCRCGDVLKGAIVPKECPLFGKRCSPKDPVGPCMVSTEGSCAAWYKYGGL